MNVTMIHVITMPPALIMEDHMSVHASQAILEMVIIVQVSPAQLVSCSYFSLKFGYFLRSLVNNLNPYLHREGCKYIN